MRELVLDGRQAWEALATWRKQDGVRMLPEPELLDRQLANWSREVDLRAGAWTDAYLAAFAVAGGARLVTFDGGFTRFDGLRLLHLEVE
jgi:predicted nucleic acid-binding protein